MDIGEKYPPFPRLILNLVTVSLGSFLFGFHIGWPSNALPLVTEQMNLSTGWSSSVVAVMMLGAMGGSLVGGAAARRLGRRGGILLSCGIMILGSVIMAVAPVSSDSPGAGLSRGGLALLIIGRFVCGFGVGTVSVVVPLYINEASPPARRGGLGCINQLMITAGILYAFLLGYAYDGESSHAWRWSLISSGGVAAVLAISVLTFIPESPAWPEPEPEKGRSSASPLSPQHRGALIAGVLLMLFQQFCGVNAVLAYSVTIFELAGLSEAAQVNASVLVAATQVVATGVSVLITDKFRRKTLIVGTLAIMAGCHTGLGIFFKVQKGVVAAEILLAVYIAAFSVGIGPLAWAVIAEVADEAVKGPTVTTCVVVNWLSAFTITASFKPLADSAGPSPVFFSFAAICAVGVVVVSLVVPETRSKGEADATDFVPLNDP